MSTGSLKGSWKTRGSKELFSSGVFRLRVDECELPDGRVMPRYYVLEFPDWANIIPVTEDNQIVLVEQYRHAHGRSTLEIPGGSTDSEDLDPLAAVRRELLEETGYQAREIRPIGRHNPNPAMQSNWMHTFIGYGCHKVSEPKPDPFEDLRVVVKSIPDVYQMIFNGQIDHSIVVASLLYALPHLGFQLPAR
ncbi:MAG: NUDIX hydrolase [Bdellovibrionaceae bacterium]|nr:NUDIX hydrolase [Pseudobdellovibrionaceae bacterium]